MKLFAQTCETLSTESSSLQKVETIAQALKSIPNDQELGLFCLYLTGSVYPVSIQKTINVGKAWLRDAACMLLGISKEQWSEAYAAFGETGEVIESLLQRYEKLELNMGLDIATPGDKNNAISLLVLAEYIELLNENSKSSVKVLIIADLLSRLTPLEAKYAAKLLLQRMRIGVQEASVEDGIAKAFDVDKKQVKHLNFYLGDIGEVAVRCKDKNFEDIEFRLFHPIKAMLASAEVDVEDIFKRMGDQVWAEYKYDGMRAHIHGEGGRIEIYTRDLKRVTDQFPEVVEHMKPLSLKMPFLVDGEIVPYKDGEIKAFADLQKRLGRKEKINEAARDNPTAYIAYDLLYLNRETLFGLTLQERRNKLEETFGSDVMYSTKEVVSNSDAFLAFFRKSKEEGREGLLVKNPSSHYESGKRGIHWLKYKQTLDPLDVVVLEAEFGEGKNAKYLSNYIFGVWNHDRTELVPIGRVYSGIKEDELKHYTAYLPTIATEKTVKGYKLEPKEIFEVGFENIQKSERYTSGYAVRFPRILRIRTGDKPLDEISTIGDVEDGWRKLN
ncbi:MAG: ATP-dependent DNA ligase [Candidatus Dojkabacteria bacterium]